jgi:hypothetical protein
VDRSLVFERHDSKLTIAELRNTGSETKSIFVLAFNVDRASNHGDAPLAPWIGTLPKNLGLEVLRESIVGHADKARNTRRAASPILCAQLTPGFTCKEIR